MVKAKEAQKSDYKYRDRNITCEFYHLEHEHDNCSLCSNKTFCRKSRKMIVDKEKYAAKKAKRTEWENFIKEVSAPGSTPEKSADSDDDKTPAIPNYQKEENILKLNWDCLCVQDKVTTRKARKNTLSAKAMKKINRGEVPTLKIEI